MERGTRGVQPGRLLLPLLLVLAGAADVGPPGWRKLATEPYKGKRDDVFFVDHARGWYGTGRGDLFATSDGGTTWRKVASRPGTFIRALGFVDEKTGFIGNVGDYYPGVTDDVPLYRTDDGGTTWNPVDLGGAVVKGICAIDVLRSQRIHQGRLVPSVSVTAAGRVGGPAALIRSMDAGRTWRVIDMSAWTSMILDVRFIDERTGFVAASTSADVPTTNAQILMTTDGGASWRSVYRSRRPQELVWKLSFPSRRVGYGTVQSYDRTNRRKVVVKSTDGGRSWRELDLTDDAATVELGVGFVDERRGWIGTTTGSYQTSDGGRSFTKADVAPAANRFRMVQGPAGTSVYAIGSQLQRLDLAAKPSRSTAAAPLSTPSAR